MFATSAMHSSGVGRKSIEERVQMEVRAACEVIAKHSGQAYDPTDLLAMVPINIICSIVMGDRYLLLQISIYIYTEYYPLTWLSSYLL